jgi:nucleoside 2-deoxyribosyltransferase
MNYLRDKQVYLCGAMFGYDDSGVAWRDMLTPHLKDMGIDVVDPTKTTANGVGEVEDDKKRFRDLILKEDWVQLKEEFWPIVRKDLRAVDKADFLICYYNPIIPTIGTIHELVVASQQKKPILLKYDREHLHKFNPWVSCLIKHQYFHNNWESLLEHLRTINDGVFDTSYWTL